MEYSLMAPRISSPLIFHFQPLNSLEILEIQYKLNKQPFNTTLTRISYADKEKITGRLKKSKGNLSFENLDHLEHWYIYTLIHNTCVSQRTTAFTRSLYSSILWGGNRKCLRAYSWSFWQTHVSQSDNPTKIHEFLKRAFLSSQHND